MEKYVFPSFLSLGELNNWIDRKKRRRRRSRGEKITKRVSKTRTKGLAGKDSETVVGKRAARSGFLEYYVSPGRKFVSRWKQTRTMPGWVNPCEFSELVSWSRAHRPGSDARNTHRDKANFIDSTRFRLFVSRP